MNDDLTSLMELLIKIVGRGVFQPGHVPNPTGDPYTEMLLDKKTIAQIRVKELDAKIRELDTNLEIAKMTRDALKAQYKLK